ncbi:uncharacterized protein LOC123515704 isoform X2 [Portunus trituberculatus]|uniref:uncharacterized protein LOC123515704 isoform X2 n=1 Tax=Portunus trituberculatus TaxID=210409 RepID=UPI001E1CCE24|nr:uncharacterized protein LOC123515704 isoform X2 [Portunus trituberculatus]
MNEEERIKRETTHRLEITETVTEPPPTQLKPHSRTRWRGGGCCVSYGGLPPGGHGVLQPCRRPTSAACPCRARAPAASEGSILYVGAEQTLPDSPNKRKKSNFRE